MDNINIKVKKVQRISQENGNAKPRLYIWVDKEAVLENLENRRKRPYTIYRMAVPEILKKAGFNSEGVKANWSQTAGCSCGCSPGFILNNTEGIYDDIHASIKVSN